MNRAHLPCSQASLDAGEPIFATATSKTDIWLLLEFEEQWSPKILDSAKLPARTRLWLTNFLDDHKQARVQFIKRAADDSVGTRAPGRRFFFGTSGEANAALWEFSFEDPVELEAIDLNALVANHRVMPERRRYLPLFLVCTHGKRDACCAKAGPPVFRALQRERGDQVWQTSHIGGHRFAATMLCFPHGHCFGRLDPAAASRVALGFEVGVITELDRYRGRTTYAGPVQAAEYFVRQSLGIFGINALRYTRGEIAGDDRWQVRFFDETAGESHELTIVRTSTADHLPTSCGKPVVPMTQYQLESHRQLGTGADG